MTAIRRVTFGSSEKKENEREGERGTLLFSNFQLMKINNEIMRVPFCTSRFPFPSSHTSSPAAYIINKKKAEVPVEQGSEGRCVVAEPAAEAKSMQGTKAFFAFSAAESFRGELGA